MNTVLTSPLKYIFYCKVLSPGSSSGTKFHSDNNIINYIFNSFIHFKHLVSNILKLSIS